MATGSWPSLVCRARGGDRAAFDELVRGPMPACTRWPTASPATRRMHADVVQECVPRAYRGLRAFGGTPVYDWMYRITANCASTQMARRAETAMRIWTTTTRSPMAGPIMTLSGRASPASDRDRVAQAVAELPPVCGRWWSSGMSTTCPTRRSRRAGHHRAAARCTSTGPGESCGERLFPLRAEQDASPEVTPMRLTRYPTCPVVSCAGVSCEDIARAAAWHRRRRRPGHRRLQRHGWNRACAARPSWPVPAPAAGLAPAAHRRHPTGPRRSDRHPGRAHRGAGERGRCRSMLTGRRPPTSAGWPWPRRPAGAAGTIVLVSRASRRRMGLAG